MGLSGIEPSAVRLLMVSGSKSGKNSCSKASHVCLSASRPCRVKNTESVYNCCPLCAGDSDWSRSTRFRILVKVFSASGSVARIWSWIA